MVLLILSGPGALYFLSFLGYFILQASAGIVNRTIDDTFGDSQTGQLVTYVPPPMAGVWKDENCVGCAINPDVSQAFKRTYTAATYNPGLGTTSITMKFTGIAIYVYFILANNAGDGITTLTLANFTLDGNAPQLFQHAPDLTTTALQYNQLVFSQANLVNADHTLVISTSGVNTNVYVNFDYAIYTHDDNGAVQPLPPPGSSSSSSSASSSSQSSSISTSTVRSSTTSALSSTSSSTKSDTGSSFSSSTIINSNPPTSTSSLGRDSASSNSKSTPTGAIVGGVVAGVAALLLLALCLIWRVRKRRANSENTKSVENGFTPALMTERRVPPSPATINPFILENDPSDFSRNDVQYGSHGNRSRHSPATSRSLTSPVQDSMYSTAYAYDGIADSNSNDGQRRPEGSTTSSSVLAYYGRGPLRSVTSGDHLSSPSTDFTTPSQTPVPGHRNSNSVEDVRRARQDELNQRLRTVQEEMAFLASDMTGQKTRPQSVRRRRTITRPVPGGGGGMTTVEVEEEGELTVAEMREQLQMLRDQVSYLREQQRSDWAQGLSDDPPPGYTPASPPVPPPHPLPPIPGQ